MIQPLKLLSVIIIIILTAACSMAEKPLPQSSQQDSRSSYVYGKFHLNADVAPLKIAVIVEDAKGDSYYLSLKETPLTDVYAIKLTPGSYTFGEFAYLRGAELISRKPLALHKGLITFDLKPNTAYYLGDYTGETTIVNDSLFSHHAWLLSHFADQYTKTTAIFKQRYPHFAQIPTVNLAQNLKFDKNLTPTANTDRLMALIKAENFEQAEALGKKLYDEHNPVAINLLGNMYALKKYPKHSILQAANAYFYAAKLSLPEAMSNLGFLIIENDSVNTVSPEKDKLKNQYGGKAEGIHWLEKAATHFEPSAIDYLCFAITEPAKQVYIHAMRAAWCHIGADVFPKDKKQLRARFQDKYETIMSTLTPKQMKYENTLENRYRMEMFMNASNE